MGPLVTISIPAYRARFLREAIASAVAQTWPYREIFVSQDGDDPEIPLICAEFPEVTLVPGPNLGLQRMWANFDRCLTIGSGTYVKLLCDDDLLAPNCVHSMVAVFESSQGRDVTLVGSRRWRIDESGTRAGILGGFPDVDGDAIKPRGALWWPVIRRLHNFIGELTTVMVRRRDLLLLGAEPLMALGTDVAFQRDLRLFLHLNRYGRTAMFHRPLSSFRVHPGQTSNLMDTPEYALKRLRPWIGLVEMALALGEIDEAQYRHGLRQVDRLRLKMIDGNQALQPLLEPVRQRIQELQAVAGMRQGA